MADMMAVMMPILANRFLLLIMRFAIRTMLTVCSSFIVVVSFVLLQQIGERGYHGGERGYRCAYSEPLAYGRGIALGLASSSTKSDILKALDSMNIRSYFKVILSGEEFVESKPDPAIYEEAARQICCPKEDILVVEDSEKGIAAGVAAGLTTWAVKDTRFGMDQSQAAGFIHRLSDLLEKD